MYYIPEHICERYITEEMIFSAVSEVFVAMSKHSAQNFSTVREALGLNGAIFGIKSGVDYGGKVLGLKAGGYWPANAARGLTNHQSSILVFNPDTGEPYALVRGNYLTGLRTAAASSLAIKYLARPDARVLGIIGAGTQSLFQVKAALAQRDFQKLLISDLNASSAQQLFDTTSKLVDQAMICDVQQLVRNSDVVITLTPSFNAIIQSGWVQSGTHFSCMGADTKGKQEIESEILSRARVFCDDKRQAVTIGECQHAFRSGALAEEDLVPIGEVISGANKGRHTEEEVTVFDGTGVGLQDLVAARVALSVALEKGLALKMD